MDLPVPNQEEVAEFQKLYAHQTGIEMSHDDALGLLTSLVQFFYLTQYDEM